MRKNVRKDVQDRRKTRQKIEKISTLVLLLVLIISLITYWYLDNDYEDFISDNDIDELVENQQYDSALRILRRAMDNPELRHIKEEAEQKYEQIRLLAKEEKPTKDFKAFENRIERLTQQLMFDSVIARLERALVDSNYSEGDRQIMKNRLAIAQQDKESLESGRKITIPVPYVVKSGETLNGIAYRHNMKPTELMKINDLESNMLKQGQEIQVYARVDFETHKVKSGENLSRIAIKHKTSIEKIKKLNNMQTDEVQAGQILKVRLITSADQQE